MYHDLPDPNVKEAILGPPDAKSAQGRQSPAVGVEGKRYQLFSRGHELAVRIESWRCCEASKGMKTEEMMRKL